MGSHHARHAETDDHPMRRIAIAVIAPLALVTLAGLVWLWPPPVEEAPTPEGAGAQYDAEVTAIEQEPCPEEPEVPEAQSPADQVNGCGTATVRVTEGQREGTEYDVPLPNGPGAAEIVEGDQVVLLESETPDGATYAIVDHQRDSQLWLLGIAFVLAVVAFGRWRGVSALAGLAVTFFVLLYFVVPAILDGSPPLLVAIIGSAAIMLTVLYLTHGLAWSTTVAVLGTLGSLALTGVLALVAVEAMHLTGFADDASTFVGEIHSVNLQGLLLAGIVIGSLGVLDDVTVTQSATVTELARANPTYRFGDLYRAGARVGRSHIASVINTIILAYAGSSLPLMILIIAGNQSFGDVVTDQIIAQEIVRSAVATIGLVAAVPLTTALGAATARRGAPRRDDGSLAPGP
ncbi:YibE/F family protein [Nocardioides panacisoli]|uniref:YibE/F family protein n=1 Tax=Nocardioides panacisoli TaxID=627624 RepID=UPI001C629DF4|nr:YibE/F family protein [Nocardioides panacisoli]QYJ05635.1 YibE/F family protein [Nocardioides panacisoli]